MLRVLAEGLNPQEAANRLSVAITTIHAHKTQIFEHCRSAWDLPLDDNLDYRWLRDKFRTYFKS